MMSSLLVNDPLSRSMTMTQYPRVLILAPQFVVADDGAVLCTAPDLPTPPIRSDVLAQ